MVIYDRLIERNGLNFDYEFWREVGSVRLWCGLVEAEEGISEVKTGNLQTLWE